MSFLTLAALNAAIVVPTQETVIAGDLLIDDAGDALKDKAVDQFKLHLLSAVSVEDVSAYFTAYETAYKTGSKKTAMPGHYRSNKSVLLNCEKYSIPVIDASGFPRGKTELEKAIKAAKEGEKSAIEQALATLERLTKVSDKLDQAELDVLVNAMSLNFPQLVVVKKMAA